MAEQGSSQEKTEQATAQKLKKSRDDGQVTRSKDVATAVSLLASLLVLKFGFLAFYQHLRAALHTAWAGPAWRDLGRHDLALLAGEQIGLLADLLAPLLLASLAVVVFSLVPGGWIFASKNLHFKASKLNPITGLGRMVSAQNWSELAKSLLKMLALGGVAWWLLGDALNTLLALQRSQVGAAVGAAFALSFNVLLGLLAVFVGFALIDIPLQRFFFLKKLRMSKQERKEEHKNQEGRPEVKARIRQLQRQLLHRQISRAVPLADAVIVNPEHFAVALKYDPLRAQAPYVLAKGMDETALYIRSLAVANHLEVIEIAPLARALYFTTRINQQIPAPLYAAVAHVLAYVLQLKAWRQGLRARPVQPGNLAIPPGLFKEAPP